MTGGIEAVGSLVEGGLLARAVEPAAGEGKGHTHERSCLNCGTPLIGPHCHECGQHAHIHRTMGAFFHDLAHGVLHFDGKTFRTLPLLAWKPGELTRRYIAGERARFVSPMALFLFSVFLMFAVFQLAGIGPPTDLGRPDPGERSEQDLAKSQEYLAQTQGSPRQDEQRQSRGADPRRADRRDREEARAATPSRRGRTRSSWLRSQGQRARGSPSRYTGYRFFDHAIDKWRENPGLMAYKLQSNSYKFSWLLIPLSVPFVWLLFAWRRQFGAYDHAVFVTYSLSFMTLFYVVLVLLGGIGVGTGTLMLLGTIVPLAHIYKQVKGAYGLSRFSAAWRTFALSAFIFLILFLYIDVLLVLGAAD